MSDTQKLPRWIWLLILVFVAADLLLARLSATGIAIFFVAVTFGLAIAMIFIFRPDSKK